MDASEEDPRRQHNVSKVLGDDNLLREIIVRVGFPTTLVRAALVCKRWLGHASDPALLRCFRKLHPPCLLGYYISDWLVMPEQSDARYFGLMQPQHPELHLSPPRFVPMLPQPPELATVICHLDGYRFGVHDGSLQVMHCKNATVFTSCYNKRGTNLTFGVHRPMCPERGMPIVPPFPCVDRDWFGTMLSKEDGRGGLSYLYVLGTKESGKFMVRVYVLQDGVWRIRTSAPCHPRSMHSEPKAVLVGNKIYMPAGSSGDIIVLDLMTSSFSTIQLPQGVSYNYFRTMLSPADDDSGVYLIHVNEFQLRIWLSKGANWLLVDTVYLKMLDHTLEDKHSANVQIIQVGDNAEFVFLRMTGLILYLDVTRKTLHRVHEMAKKDRHFGLVKPFMMIWPPIFPVLKDNPSRKRARSGGEATSEAD